MGLIALLGVILVVVGVIDLFVKFIAGVGAIVLIVIGVILAIVGHYFAGSRGWGGGYGWRRGGPGGPAPY